MSAAIYPDMSLDVPWDDYPMRASGDPAKSDLELVHAACGERVCDVEADDTLPAMAAMAAEHEASCPDGRALR